MKKYLHEKVAPLSKFIKGSVRTIDPGRPGHMKLKVARLKEGPHAGKTRVVEIMYEKKYIPKKGRW